MKRRRFGRRKVCKFCADKVDLVDYKDVRRLRGLRHRARQDHPATNLGQLRPPSASAHARDQARAYGGPAAVRGDGLGRRHEGHPARRRREARPPRRGARRLRRLRAELPHPEEARPQRDRRATSTTSTTSRSSRTPRPAASRATPRRCARGSRRWPTRSGVRPPRRASCSARSPRRTSPSSSSSNGVKLERRRIHLDEPIKTLGETQRHHSHPSRTSPRSCKVSVVRDE